MTTTFQPRGRLPVAGPTPRERRSERLRGAAALLGTLVVVIGVPVALLVFIGNPLPTSLPSRDWLTADISIDVILKVIALVVWAVWAHFVVCLLTEFRAARRGSGLPTAVPFGGGNQFLARKLVAAALLLAGAATLAPQASASGPANTPGISATAEAAWGARYQAQAVQIAHQQAAAEQAAEASADDASNAPDATADEVYYTVQPPNGRNHDTLWDISERTLGDPFRYKEIYQLNLDRVQPDGRKLVDADLIYPGWVLMMPADASGPGLTVVEPIGAPVSAPVAPPVEPASETAQAEPSADAAEHASLAGGLSDDGAGADAATETDTGHLALGGGLLAAGVLLALSGRRGPYRPETEDEERLRLAADTGTADLLDRALRHLAAGRASQGQALPEAVLAYAGPERVVLHLSGAADSPALKDPPEPWKLGENGRSWSVAADDVAGMTAPDVAAPYPALVNVASTHGYELLVDLEAAPGLVSIGGDTSTAREVAVSMAAELATNVWSDGVRVTLVGFGDDLVEIAPQHMEQVGDLSDVLDEVERSTRVAEELSRSLGIHGVLAGRLSRGAERFRPRVLVLSAPPTPAEASRLQQLLSRGRTPLAAVCVGDSVAARWRFVVDSTGSIDLGALGVKGTARTLAPEQYRGITSLLRDLDAGRVERSVEVAAMTPAAGLADATPPGGAAAALGVPAPRAADLTRTADVQIKLLGPVEVLAPGTIDERQRPLLVSFVVAVALADEGLHDAVLRATVWPRGVTDEIVAATATAVTAWLGDDAAGRPRLRQDDDDAWWLSDDVACDYDALRHVAGGDPSDLESQLAVLALGRGEAFSSATGERFSSFAFARAAQQTRVLVTTLARQAGASAVSSGRHDLAERALRRGLSLVPTAEPLWRDLLRLLGPEGAPATAENMYAALAYHRVRPEPETDALVEQLVPGSPRRMA